MTCWVWIKHVGHGFWRELCMHYTSGVPLGKLCTGVWIIDVCFMQLKHFILAGWINSCSLEVWGTLKKIFDIIGHKTFCCCCCCWIFYLGLYVQAFDFIHYLCKRVGWQPASVWIQPNNSWTEQYRALPASYPVMGSFTLSARSHDRLENTNRLLSPGRPHLTDIILSDLRSELRCSSFSVAGRHLVTQPEWRTFLWHQSDPLSRSPHPVFINIEWKKNK